MDANCVFIEGECMSQGRNILVDQRLSWQKDQIVGTPSGDCQATFEKANEFGA